MVQGMGEETLTGGADTFTDGFDGTHALEKCPGNAGRRTQPSFEAGAREAFRNGFAHVVGRVP